MPTYLHPGVYIEEIPSGSRPIEGVSTSTAAFIGKAPRGPAGVANLIQSLSDYQRDYGGIASEDDAMGLSVQAFYLNGGKAAYICRLAGEGSVAAASQITGQDSGATPVVRIQASSVGEWGNDVYFRIVKPDRDALTFDLEVGVQNDGVFEVTEAFSALSMREDDANYALNVVNAASAMVSVELADEAAVSALYQAATITGGAVVEADVIAAITQPMALTVNINGLGARQITIDPASGFADAAAIADAITTAIQGLGTDSAYTAAVCEFSPIGATNRFRLSTPVAGSSALLSIASGDLSKLLRFDSQEVATLTGTDVGSVDFNSSVSGLPSLTQPMSMTLNVDNHGALAISLNVADLGLTGANSSDGAAIARAIQNAVRGPNLSIPALAGFRCAYQFDASGPTGQFVLSSGSGSSRVSSLSIVDDTGGLAEKLAIHASSAALMTPGREVNQGTARVVPVQSLGTLDQGVQLNGDTAGVDVAPTVSDFASFYDNVMRKVRDASIIITPGEHWRANSDNGVIAQTLAFCESVRRSMLIIDPPPDVELLGGVVDDLGLPTSTYSVLYYPWVQMANPFYHEETNPTAAKSLAVAPSALAAGMWAKIDARRGVWKAPAGVETQLLGVASLGFDVEDGEQDQLNPRGVNCIRKQPGFGSVFWGARTLSTRANPEWRYVPVRRTAIFIEQSIYNGIQWAVFEPNDHPLWSSLRANVGNFMNGLFRAGAFQGATANDAYFVRCGLGDTMTQGDIDAGQVIVIVGFAPVKPAEFVIVRIQQKVNQQ